MFNSTRWLDKFEVETPDSALHYSITQAEVLVRYTSTPVYTANSADLFGEDPIGVIITVDAVNGKTRMPEVRCDMKLQCNALHCSGTTVCAALLCCSSCISNSSGCISSSSSCISSSSSCCYVWHSTQYG
jgi:hypothetical protein